MGITVSCPLVARDRDLARSAAQWIEASYADVVVQLAEESVMLAAETRSAPALRLLWRTGLLNERLFADAEAGRAAVLDSLVR